jgi:putative ABC transport system permease protein
VIRYYRSEDPFRGDYDGRPDFLFERLRLDAPPRDGLAMLVKVRPGVTAAFEEKLMRTMKAIAGEMELSIMRYDQRQARSMDQALGMFTVLAVLAAFLLVMVALGLSGVVWQSVTRRTAEIGLRRAQGATAADIRRQFLGEFLAIATLAMAPGALVVANFAGVISNLSYFGIGFVPARVYLAAFAFSVLTIYVLVSAACYVPSRLAARVQPLAALRYE